MVSERQSQIETSPSTNYQPSYEYTGATLLGPETDVAFRLAGAHLLSVEEAHRMAAQAPIEREDQRSPDEQKIEVIKSVNRNLRAMRDLALAA